MKDNSKTNSKSPLSLWRGLGRGVLLRSVWHQRRSYAWICLELVVVALFTWNVADPLYYIEMNRAIPDGYDRDGLWYATFEHLEAEAPSDTVCQMRWQELAQLLRNDDEVIGSLTCGDGEVLGLGYSTISGVTNCDSLPGEKAMAGNVSCLCFYTADGIDPVELYGLKLITRRLPMDGVSQVFLTRNVAEDMFGTIDCVGRRVDAAWYGEKEVVAGVVENVKYTSLSQPGRFAVCWMVNEGRRVMGMKHDINFLFRLRDGGDIGRLCKTLEAKADGLGMEMTALSSLDELNDNVWQDTDDRNTVRLMRLLCSFGLACVLLGMLGTFWVRCAARRGDIAVMRALGATRLRVALHFLSEAAMIVTLACIVAAPLIYAQVQLYGVHGVKDGGNELYVQNLLVPHCLHVALITYCFLLFTALLGAAIPVVKAVQEHPLEGLKEE